MEDGTKVCCGSILVLIAIVLLIAYPLQMSIIVFTVFGVIALNKAYNWRRRRIALVNRIHGELSRIEDVIKNNRDKKLKALFSEAVLKYNKSKYAEALTLVDKFQDMYEQKVKEHGEELRMKLEEQERKKKLEFERKQKVKGLAKFIDSYGKEKWGTPEQVKNWKEIEIGLDNNFKNLNPFEFEGFVAELFQRMGYKTRDIRKTADYGCDVVAWKDNERIAIQCKKNGEGNLVGNRVVQQTLGSMHKVKANKSLIVTTSDFTVMAREQAKGAPIELWDKEDLHDMVRRYFIGKS